MPRPVSHIDLVAELRGACRWISHGLAQFTLDAEQGSGISHADIDDLALVVRQLIDAEMGRYRRQ